MDTFAYDHGLPCKNPHCRSYGRPHPNCRCYFGGEGYAAGGTVCASCIPHLPTCEYFKEGGAVALPHEHHAAIPHGLHGLLTNVGRAKMAEPEKHSRLLDEAKRHYSDMGNPIGDTEEPKKIMGMKLATHVRQGKHEDMAELMQGHPMVGGAGKGALTDILGHLSGPMMANEPNPEALRGSVDYANSAIKGHGELSGAMSGTLGAKTSDKRKPDQKGREALKKYLEEVKENPQKLLEVGGSLGHYMPEQAASLGALAATSTQYLDSLKPKPMQNLPLDAMQPVDKNAEAKYDRQLDVAQQPLLILQHVKDGTLQPQDLVTLKTIYPGLYKSFLDKAGEALITAKHEKTEIPYKQKRALSMLLGTPLDSTMTTASMQAIIKSQGPQQVQQQAKGPKKATSVEINQINKVDKLAQTPIESRQIDSKAQL